MANGSIFRRTWNTWPAGVGQPPIFKELREAKENPRYVEEFEGTAPKLVMQNCGFEDGLRFKF